MEQQDHKSNGAQQALVQVPLASGGTVYIVPKSASGEYAQNLAKNDVLVLDDRYEGNPSFQVVESHAVHSVKRMREILAAIVAFDLQTPTDPAWRRSMDSLVKEWRLHNLAYRLHVYRRSARHVDLDNRDEGKGYAHFFFVAAARVWERILHRLRRNAR